MLIFKETSWRKVKLKLQIDMNCLSFTVINIAAIDRKCCERLIWQHYPMAELKSCADLIRMNIGLAGGLSFSIFHEVEIISPVILQQP